MMSGLRPQALMRTEGEFAHICAWCPDKVDAERARAPKSRTPTATASG